jgi:3-oxoacyl-[acyl-carrier protein] reductase
MRKTAVITGGGRGIGKSISLKLASMGYNVVIAGRKIHSLNETASACANKGVEAICVKTDISCEADVKNLFSEVLDKFKKIDVLVNNAGIALNSRITETRLEDWNKIISVNLNGTFLCSKEALASMKDKKRGTIINIASVVGIKGYPSQGAYTASKHGVVGLSKVLAEEGREYGVKIHVICPGGVATDMVRDMRPDINQEELIQPENVAELVEYFLKLPENITVDMVHLRRFGSSSF